MKATDFIPIFESKKYNVIFANYEELNIELDNADYPCLAIVPISKSVQYIADEFRKPESIVIAYVDKIDEFDSKTSDLYNLIEEKESEILTLLYPYMDKITNLQVISEINKFDAHVLFAGIAFDLDNRINIC